MKKLYWVICNFEKQKKVSEIDFEGLNRIANDSGYEVEFAFISKENYCSEEEFDRLKKDRKRPRDLSAYLYSSNHTENECIYDALLKVSAERYFVCDARYLKHEDTIREMLEISSFYKMHFVRCKKDYDGIFATPVKFIKQTHNKVLGLVTNTKNEKYVRNFVVFNEEVLEYMKRNPINSAVIRETDMLFNANSENVEAPKDFKRAKHYLENWTSYLVGFASLFLCIWCFISMFILRTNLDLFTWLLIGIIVFGITAILTINFAVANSKTVFYRPFWKKEECKPIFEIKKKKIRITKKKKEEE